MKTDKENVNLTLKFIGSKWTVLIFKELCHGTKRFNEIAKALPGVSPRTLSERLKQLESHGVVKKKIFAEVPPHVEYTMTTKGQQLRQIIETVQEWNAKPRE